MADETELVERVRSGSLTFRNGNPVPSGDTCVVKSDDLRALCDTIEALQRERADAYEEGVEDGISWHCFPESGPRPTWAARAALSAEPTVAPADPQR